MPITPGGQLVRLCPEGCRAGHRAKRIPEGWHVVCCLSPRMLCGVGLIFSSPDLARILGCFNRARQPRSFFNVLGGSCDWSWALGPSGFLSSCCVICSSEASDATSRRDNRLRACLSPMSKSTPVSPERENVGVWKLVPSHAPQRDLFCPHRARRPLRRQTHHQREPEG